MERDFPTVELYGLLEGYRLADVSLLFCSGGLLFGGDVIVDVRLVVLLMMDLHDFSADEGLEGTVVVREIWELGHVLLVSVFII